jgi:hypothetical protein
MKKLVLLLAFLVFTIQFLSCSPKNPWENDDKSDDVSSVSAVNNTQVEVVFSTGVEESSAETATNYSIKAGGTTLAVNSAVRDASDNKIVRLTTGSQDNVEYTLIVTNVTTIASGNIKSKTIDTTNSPDKFTGEAVFKVVSAESTGCNSVRVTFSKTLGTGANVPENYQINSGSLAVSSATVSDKIVNLVTSDQSSISYTLVVSNVYDTNSVVIDSGNNTAYISGDARPALISANWVEVEDGGAGFKVNHFRIEFSEAVNGTDAAIAANYILNPTLTISSINMVNDTTYELITSEQTQGNTYQLYVQNIHDMSGNNNVTDGTNVISFSGKHCPYIDNIVYVDNKHLLIYFSEDVEGSVAQNTNNYVINGVVNPTLASRSINIFEYHIVGIEMSTINQFISGNSYTLSIYNIQDNTTNNNIITIPNEINFTAP